MTRLATLMASVLPSEIDSTQRKSHITYTLPSPSPGSASLLGLGTSSKDFSEISSDYINEEEERAILAAERSITLLESRSVISVASNTGQRTWEAALHLSAYLACADELEDNKNGNRAHIGSIIRGRHVLELGAGTGLVSIVCARYLGARMVLATDGDEGIVEVLKSNMFLNGLDVDGGFEKNDSEGMQYFKQTKESSERTNSDSMICRVQAKVLRWGGSLRETSLEKLFESEPPDIVVAADVVSVLHFLRILFYMMCPIQFHERHSLVA